MILRGILRLILLVSAVGAMFIRGAISFAGTGDSCSDYASTPREVLKARLSAPRGRSTITLQVDPLLQNAVKIIGNLNRDLDQSLLNHPNAGLAVSQKALENLAKRLDLFLKIYPAVAPMIAISAEFGNTDFADGALTDPTGNSVSVLVDAIQTVYDSWPILFPNRPCVLNIPEELLPILVTSNTVNSLKNSRPKKPRTVAPSVSLPQPAHTDATSGVTIGASEIASALRSAQNKPGRAVMRVSQKTSFDTQGRIPFYIRAREVWLPMKELVEAWTPQEGNIAPDIQQVRGAMETSGLTLLSKFEGGREYSARYKSMGSIGEYKISNGQTVITVGEFFKELQPRDKVNGGGVEYEYRTLTQQIEFQIKDIAGPLSAVTYRFIQKINSNGSSLFLEISAPGVEYAQGRRQSLRFEFDGEDQRAKQIESWLVSLKGALMLSDLAGLHAITRGLDITSGNITYTAPRGRPVSPAGILAAAERKFNKVLLFMFPELSLAGLR